MPRNGSGVYSFPPNTNGGPSNTPISSTKYNTRFDDVAADLNAARPIVAGGTGATSVGGARQALTTLDTKNSGYTAVSTDAGAVHRCTATFTVALSAAATLGANWPLTIIADGGDVMIDPNASETINGGTTLIIPNGCYAFIVCSGSTFYATTGTSKNVFFDAADSTKRVHFDLTGITTATDRTVIFPDQNNLTLSKWEVIKDDVLSGSSATYDVTGLSGYRMIKIEGHIYPATDGAIGLRTSTNNGSSYDSGGSDYGWQYILGSATTAAAASGNSDNIPLTNTNTVDNIADRGLLVNITLYNFNKAQWMRFIQLTNYENPTGVMTTGTMGGRRNDTAARNALRIFAGSNLNGFLTVQGWRG